MGLKEYFFQDQLLFDIGDLRNKLKSNNFSLLHQSHLKYKKLGKQKLKYLTSITSKGRRLLISISS
jgi:hypothetical protein